MKPIYKGLSVLALTLLASVAVAQDSGERRGPPPGVSRGDYQGPRPPENASPEERRAFWQARAAERAKVEAAGGQALVAAPTAGGRPPVAAGKPENGKPAAGNGRPREMGQHNHAAMGSSPGQPTSAGVPPAGDAGQRFRGRGDGMLWLSDLPPRREGNRGRPASDSGMSGMGGNPNGGVPTKRFWLRAGGNPLTARNVPSTETALVLDPTGKQSSIEVEDHGGPYNVSVPTPEVGFYNVYLLQQNVDQEQLSVTVAKAESPRSMGHSSPENIKELMVPRLDSRVPVEIIRERKEKEKFFTRINYGDNVTFQVLRQGKPVQNARVTMTTGQGWSNSQQSDEDGRATFVMIRDYYPDWDEFEKRHRETFVVSATFSTEDKGDLNGAAYKSARYTSSLAGSYYPSSQDYKSYTYGLLIGVGFLVFTGTAVYLYRRRRVKPFQEVTFDEKS